MADIKIKTVGEYIPKTKNTLGLNNLKEFVCIPYSIAWYKSRESKKIFPMFMQEISDLNPTRKQFAGVLTRNPFFDHTRIIYFNAYKNSSPAGRIMAFIDENYNQTHGQITGWLGLFESIEDKEVAKELIQKGIDYLKSNGCKKILGPAKFNANGELGLLIEGFDKKPYFMEPYNAPYYQEFFEDFGFKKENDWYSMNTDETLANGYLSRVENLMGKMTGTRRSEKLDSFNIRNISFKNIFTEIRTIKDLYNPIWGKGNHPQFTKMTDAEFNTLATGIKAIALEDLIFIVEEDKKAIGVSVSIPNINEVIEEYDNNHFKNKMPSANFLSLQDLKRDLNIFNIVNKRLKDKNFKSIRVLILGVEEKYRKTGLDSLLYYKTAINAKSLGITHCSGSQLADENVDILNPLFKIGKVSMTWRVYSLDI